MPVKLRPRTTHISLLALGALLEVGSGEQEGALDVFLGEEKFDTQRLFEGERNPNIVVALDGTVVASWGEVEDNFALGRKGIRIRRSEEGGESWGPLITVVKPCWHGGGVTVDDDPPGADCDPALRWEAWSEDGGPSWKDAATCRILPDGARKSVGPGSGCLAGLVRLPVSGRDILLYSNCDSPTTERRDVTVWASFDGAKTWPLKRRVWKGPSAYSSFDAGRPKTASEGWIYILLEGGERHRYEDGHMARFNLSWLLQGERTGDGELTGWLKRKDG